MKKKNIYIYIYIFVGVKMLFKLNSDSLIEFWDKIIHVSEDKNDDSMGKEWHINNNSLFHLIIVAKIKTFPLMWYYNLHTIIMS